MKPIYLEIDNFGPHAHSVIDFRKLDESPIFLIGGDTGAGKSTIFDAMTYALFSTTTSDRDAREMRSQFAGPKDATKIIFYFEQSGKIYKIERSPLQTLAKERGTGTTNRNPTANLAVVDDVDGVEIESIATKPADVGIAITEILNLNADQFKKIILLPQNDFSEFLKSNTNDKEKILKKIFGTQLFTDFTAKLKEHYDNANNKSMDFTNKLKSQIESPVWKDDEQVALKDTPSDQLATTLKDYVAQRQVKLVTAQTSEKKIAADWQKADKKYHDAETIKNNFEKLAEIKLEYQTNITDQVDTIADHQKHVAKLLWAQPLQETVRDLKRFTVEQHDTAQEEKNITKELTDYQNKLGQAKKDLDMLSTQTKEFDAKNEQAQRLDVIIAKVRDIENIRQELQQLEPQLIKAKNNVTTQNTAVSEIKANISTKQKILDDFTGLSTQKDKLSKEKDLLVDTLTPLENQRNLVISESQQLQERLKKLTDEAQIKTQALEDAKKDYQAKIKTRQSLMIAQLRQELATGEACPVCGSTEHPYADQHIATDETNLRQAMDAVDDSQKKYAATDNAVKEINQTLDNLSNEFNLKQQAAVTALRNLSSKYNELLEEVSVELPAEFNLIKIKIVFQEKIDEINQKLRQAQKLTDEIKSLEQEQQTAQLALSAATSQLERLITQQQTRTTDLQSKTQELDDSSLSSTELIQQQTQLKKDYIQFQTNLKTAQDNFNANEKIYSNTQIHLNDIKARLTKQNQTIEELSDKINQSLNDSAAETNDLATLNELIQEIEQNKLSKLQNIIVSYTKEKELLTNNIDKLQQAVAGLTKPDTAALKQILDDIQAQRNIAITATANAQTDFSNAQKSLDKVQSIINEQGEFAKELAAITSLYNVVNGKDGNDSKLKLETYVVQNYLQKILSYANDTFLNRLSHNRYSFVISDKASDKQRDHGLDINVYDRETNAIRSSDTLSGGETFIAALSIALSLSEVVQSSAHGVQIDALFVDEGFGSLDDETLDEAMNALEDIGKNRMVGVISHIESMKQSIGQQLLVKKLGDGKSNIELINK